MSAIAPATTDAIAAVRIVPVSVNAEVSVVRAVVLAYIYEE